MERKKPDAEMSRPLFEDDLMDINIFTEEEKAKDKEASSTYTNEPANPKSRPVYETEERTPAGNPAHSPGEGRAITVEGKIVKRLSPQSLRPMIERKVDEYLYKAEAGLVNYAQQAEPKNVARQEPTPAPVQQPEAPAPVQPAGSPQRGTALLYADCFVKNGYVLIEKITGRVIPIGNHIVVGKDSEYATLIPPDNTTVSGRHAELTVWEGRLLVKDVGTTGEGSLNGTSINGNKLAPNIEAIANVGDVLSFSNAEYIVEKDT